MKRGGTTAAESRNSTIFQVVMSLVPLGFALWAAYITQDYVPALVFAVVWTAISLVHLVFFAHVRRQELSSLTHGHAEATMQQNRITAIINNLSDAIIATDGLTIQLSNAAAMNLLDTNTSPIGKNIDEVVKPVDEEGKELILSDLLFAATTTVQRDDVSMKAGDDLLRLSLIYTPIRGTDSLGKNAQKGHILIMRDITRQKSLEEERDEFISVVSHELRTPITIAEGALSNLQLLQQRGSSAPGQLSQGIDMAHEQILFLAGMINDLSTLSRAERGVMADKITIEVEPLLYDIYNQYAKEAAKKNLHFNIDISPQIGSVEASELYLRELIQNFVTNAIKYTAKGSVTLGAHPKDDELEFFVKDTGIGISKSDQKLVFNKFFRSEDYRTRETSGTGLGLYVARKLSHLMGTKIELESRLNHGSTFSFTLPAKRP